MTQTTEPDIYHRVPAGMAQVRRTLDQTQDDMRAAKVDTRLSDHAQIILGEVLNNVVEHAYAFVEGGPVELSIWLRTDGLWCQVSDHGVPMPNGEPPAGLLRVIDPMDPQNLPEGGFGWGMVRTLATGIDYRHEDGANHLCFLIPTPTP